jgi:hypothetical protein
MGTENVVTGPHEIQEYQSILMNQQKKVEKLSLMKHVLILIYRSTRYGVLSTLSKCVNWFPFVTVVAFQLNEESKPFFIPSKHYPHTHDLLDHWRISFMVLGGDAVRDLPLLAPGQFLQYPMSRGYWRLSYCSQYVFPARSYYFCRHIEALKVKLPLADEFAI